MSSRPAVAAVLLALASAGACAKDAPPAPAAGDHTAGAEPGGSGSGRRIEPFRRPVRPNIHGDGSGAPGDPPGLGDERGRPGGFRGRLAQFDKDGDGVLSDDERIAMMAARASSVMQRLDTDHDGAISAAELEGSPMARRMGDFAAADADHDGKLTVDELGTAMAERMRDGFRGGGGGWRGPTGDGSGSAGDAVISNAPDDGGE